MEFEDLVSSLESPEEDGVSETIYDDLRATHNSVVDNYQQQITELNSSNETLQKTNDELKQRLEKANFDLLTQVQKTGAEDTHNEETIVDSAENTLDDLIVPVGE